MALAEDERVHTHVILDERSAGFTALGISKASRRPAAVVCTSGTAAANLHPAVLEAHHSRAPLLVLTADRPPELRSVGATQTIDQLKLYGNAVRWFVDVGIAEPLAHSERYWRSLAARAHVTALGPPAGPVHMNVALREPLVPTVQDDGWPFELEGREHNAPWITPTLARAVVDEPALVELASRIADSERGLLVIGTGEVDAGSVIELARAAGWPVLAEPTSGVRLGDNAITTYDSLLRSEHFRSSHVPELVLRLGTLGISRALTSWLAPHIPQVVIDPDASWSDAERSAASLVRADPAPLCGALAQRLGDARPSRWLTSWREHDERALGVIDEILDADQAPSEPRTARDVAAALPHGATLVAGSSMPVRDLDWFMRARDGLRVLANRGTNGIDGFVSTTLGAALACRGAVAALCGDLSLLHDQNGLMSARREGIDAVFVVLNNDGGGVFNFLPQSDFPQHFERLFATPHGVDLGALASLYGCGFTTVGRADELVDALRSALEAGEVHVIEVRTSRAANVELHERIWRAVDVAATAQEP
jgi:2-succinyl-5-enolpyruvyl-6-hydroxy-3-cyclohexene-1-carboxylate synthase